jgi:hypothetical protein
VAVTDVADRLAVAPAGLGSGGVDEHEALATVSGVSDNSPGNAIGMSLTPTLNGFELNVQVSATYTAADLGNMDVSEAQDIGG